MSSNENNLGKASIQRAADGKRKRIECDNVNRLLNHLRDRIWTITRSMVNKRRGDPASSPLYGLVSVFPTENSPDSLSVYLETRGRRGLDQAEGEPIIVLRLSEHKDPKSDDNKFTETLLVDDDIWVLNRDGGSKRLGILTRQEREEIYSDLKDRRFYINSDDEARLIERGKDMVTDRIDEFIKRHDP